jgi:hypothetical protein
MPKKLVEILKLTKGPKKFKARVDFKKTIAFGARGYQDFTIHKTVERKNRYIKRHKRKESWKKSGITTAGFWSRWLLWNKTSLKSSANDIQKRFNIKIKFVKKFSSKPRIKRRRN